MPTVCVCKLHETVTVFLLTIFTCLLIKFLKKSLKDNRPESKGQNYYLVVTREVHFENHEVLDSYIYI